MELESFIMSREQRQNPYDWSMDQYEQHSNGYYSFENPHSFRNAHMFQMSGNQMYNPLNLGFQDIWNQLYSDQFLKSWMNGNNNNFNFRNSGRVQFQGSTHRINTGHARASGVHGGSSQQRRVAAPFKRIEGRSNFRSSEQFKNRLRPEQWQVVKPQVNTPPPPGSEAARKMALAQKTNKLKSLLASKNSSPKLLSNLLANDETKIDDRANPSSEKSEFPRDLQLTADDWKVIGMGQDKNADGEENQLGTEETAGVSNDEENLDLFEKHKPYEHSQICDDQQSPTGNCIPEQDDDVNTMEGSYIHLRESDCNSSHGKRKSSSININEDVQNTFFDETNQENDGSSAIVGRKAVSITRQLRKQIFNQLLAMGKTNLKQIVNNPKSRKFQFMMQHLVKQHRALLSKRLSQRRFKASESGSQDEDEPQDCGNIFDPLASVNLSSLPQEIIAQIEKILEMEPQFLTSDEEKAAANYCSDDDIEIIEPPPPDCIFVDSDDNDGEDIESRNSNLTSSEIEFRRFLSEVSSVKERNSDEITQNNVSDNECTGHPIVSKVSSAPETDEIMPGVFRIKSERSATPILSAREEENATSIDNQIDTSGEGTRRNEEDSSTVKDVVGDEPCVSREVSTQTASLGTIDQLLYLLSQTQACTPVLEEPDIDMWNIEEPSVEKPSEVTDMNEIPLHQLRSGGVVLPLKELCKSKVFSVNLASNCIREITQVQDSIEGFTDHTILKTQNVFSTCKEVPRSESKISGKTGSCSSFCRDIPKVSTTTTESDDVTQNKEVGDYSRTSRNERTFNEKTGSNCGVHIHNESTEPILEKDNSGLAEDASPCRSLPNFQNNKLADNSHVFKVLNRLMELDNKMCQLMQEKMFLYKSLNFRSQDGPPPSVFSNMAPGLHPASQGPQQCFNLPNRFNFFSSSRPYPDSSLSFSGGVHNPRVNNTSQKRKLTNVRNPKKKKKRNDKNIITFVPGAKLFQKGKKKRYSCTVPAELHSEGSASCPNFVKHGEQNNCSLCSVQQESGSDNIKRSSHLENHSPSPKGDVTRKTSSKCSSVQGSSGYSTSQTKKCESPKNEDKRTKKSNGQSSNLQNKNLLKSLPNQLSFSSHSGSITNIKVVDHHIIAASERNVYCYSILSGKIEKTFDDHNGVITCMCIFDSKELNGKTGSCVYTGCLDSNLRQFDMQTGNLVSIFNIGEPIQSVDHSWRQMFIGTTKGKIFKHDPKTKSVVGEPINCCAGPILALKATKEGPRKILIVAAKKKPIVVRDANTGLLLRSMSGVHSFTVYSIVLDSSLVYCGTSKNVSVFDFTNGNMVTQLTAGGGVVSVRIWKNILFAACYDGKIYVFNMVDKSYITSFPGPGKMLLSMEVVDKMIFVSSSNGKLEMQRFPPEVISAESEQQINGRSVNSVY